MGWAWAIGILVGLVVFASFGYFVWLPSQMGDPAPGGVGNVLVTNRTDQPLTIVLVGSDGTAYEIGVVGAHETFESGISCGPEQWDALDPAGALVARIPAPASADCRANWVID